MQHPLKSDRGPPAFALGVIRLDRRYQPRPRHNLFHLRQEALTARYSLLPVALRFRKANLSLHHWT